MITRPSTSTRNRLSSTVCSAQVKHRFARSLVVLSSLVFIASACGDSTNLDQIAADVSDQGESTTATVAPDDAIEPAESSKPDDSTPSSVTDDFSDDEQAVLDYLRRGASIPEAEARCLIDGVNLAGVDLGSILGATLTAADDTAVTDLILTCFEEPEILATFVANWASGFSSSAGTDISIDQARCMVAALGDSGATVADLEAPVLAPALQAAFNSCLNPGDAGSDTGALIEPGSAYGDNPALDGLWDFCEAGDMAACDELYSTSEIGSEYETFGATCGQTEPGSSGGTCDISFSYGDNAALDSLWDACEGGDGAACDDLYFESPIGSVYENFGDTCGYRYDESPGFCEDAIS